MQKTHAETGCVNAPLFINDQMKNLDRKFSLLFRSCPASLEAGLTRAVLDEARSTYLNDNTQDQVDSIAPTPSANTKGKLSCGPCLFCVGSKVKFEC